MKPTGQEMINLLNEVVKKKITLKCVSCKEESDRSTVNKSIKDFRLILCKKCYKKYKECEIK